MGWGQATGLCPWLCPQPLVPSGQEEGEKGPLLLGSISRTRDAKGDNAAKVSTCNHVTWP